MCFRCESYIKKLWSNFYNTLNLIWFNLLWTFLIWVLLLMLADSSFTLVPYVHAYIVCSWSQAGFWLPEHSCAHWCHCECDVFSLEMYLDSRLATTSSEERRHVYRSDFPRAVLFNLMALFLLVVCTAMCCVTLLSYKIAWNVPQAHENKTDFLIWWCKICYLRNMENKQSVWRSHWIKNQFGQKSDCPCAFLLWIQTDI